MIFEIIHSDANCVHMDKDVPGVINLPDLKWEGRLLYQCPKCCTPWLLGTKSEPPFDFFARAATVAEVRELWTLSFQYAAMKWFFSHGKPSTAECEAMTKNPDL